MTRLGRWFILNVALGAFPLGIRLFLRIANRAALDDVLINSSDVIVLALTVSITTLADLLRATSLHRLNGTNMQEWGVYSVGSVMVFSAVWYGIQEASLFGHKDESTFRDNTWITAIVFVLAVLWLCFCMERAITQSEEDDDER